MRPLFFLQSCISRALSRKWWMVFLILALLCSSMCGIVFIKTPAFYEYHLKICDRFLDRVCYSDRNVFVIFLERTAGNALLLILVLAGGLHPACLPLPVVTLLYRFYTFGGTLAILFSVYAVPGAVVALALYLPIHLLVDAVFLLAAGISFSRAFFFSFCESDLKELLIDFLALFCLIALVCLLEMVLLLALFHPLGNLL